MRTQLRRYRIEPGRAGEFADEWGAGVAPLRVRFGFRVSGWLVEGGDEFVWLLEHDDAESFGAADTAYYESAERQEMDPDPARLIVEARKNWVTTVA
jgi:hypothetical protein